MRKGIFKLHHVYEIERPNSESPSLQNSGGGESSHREGVGTYSYCHSRGARTLPASQCRETTFYAYVRYVRILIWRNLVDMLSNLGSLCISQCLGRYSWNMKLMYSKLTFPYSLLPIRIPDSLRTARMYEVDGLSAFPRETNRIPGYDAIAFRGG